MAVVVVGAGVAGLAAGLALRRAGRAFRVLEADALPGGLARTDRVDGFSFDRTGHVLHCKNPRLARLFHSLAPLERSSRKAAVLVGQREVPYPLQYSLWALDSPALARSALRDLRRAQRRPRCRHDSFEQLLASTWGTTLMETFFRPYNEKLWGRSLDELPADCAGDFLPVVDVELVERGTRGAVRYAGYNETFLYPASGRLGDVMCALTSLLDGRVECAARVTALDLERRELRTAAGETIGYDRLVSTLPLELLAELAAMTAGPRDFFASTEIVNVRIGVRGIARAPYHWVYVVDSDLPFHRIAFPHNLSTRTCPPGCVSLSVEYTLPARGEPVDRATIARSAVDYVSRLGLVEVEECLAVEEYLISPAYVIRRAPSRPEFSELSREFAARGVRLAGRYGMWDYLSMEQAFLTGELAAAASIAADREVV